MLGRLPGGWGGIEQALTGDQFVHCTADKVTDLVIIFGAVGSRGRDLALGLNRNQNDETLLVSGIGLDIRHGYSNRTL